VIEGEYCGSVLVSVAALQDRYAGFRQTVVALWNIGSRQLSSGAPGKIEGGICSQDGVVVEEADEAILWLELMTESGIVPLIKTEHC
jgi:hypothetical protein